MNTIAESTISELSRNEKVELLQWLVKDLGDSFSCIESNPLQKIIWLKMIS